MPYTVYKVTNTLTQDFYIGVHKTEDPQDDYLGSGKVIRQHVALHGSENFTKEILLITEVKREAYQKEEGMVRPLLGTPGCLNLHPGGHGGFGYINAKGGNPNRNLGAEMRERLKDPWFHQQWLDKQLGARMQAPAWCRARITPKWQGRVHTLETKQRMSETRRGSQSGEQNSQFGTLWVSKDGVTKKIPKAEITGYEADGWVRGRTK